MVTLEVTVSIKERRGSKGSRLCALDRLRLTFQFAGVLFVSASLPLLTPLTTGVCPRHTGNPLIATMENVTFVRFHSLHPFVNV
jgi:hypothetical protein